jgi:hypothetical protein
MKQYFIVLLLMSALSAPCVFAEQTAPADDGASTTKPADSTPDPKPKPKPKPEGEEEEEPDCE